MILVDTSIWVALSRMRREEIDRGQFVQFATCGPVIQEFLQGVRSDLRAEQFQADFLRQPILSDPVPCGTFRAAAEIYRLGRKVGHTLRSTMDCLIAAIAIENCVMLWHNDRDFETIAGFTALRQRRLI
jgi:predicted nucleic acid-binding protein